MNGHVGTETWEGNASPRCKTNGKIMPMSFNTNSKKPILSI